MASEAQATVDEVAAELYGLPPDEFTATRNVRAKQARDAGDRDASAAIGKLAKPNASAWLANQLVRADADEIGSLIALGQSMRDATASFDRDRLRELSGEQRRLVTALIHRARELATAAGQRASEEAVRGLEGTLHAALADPDAAAVLAAGRLTAALQSSGFPLTGGFAAPPAGARPSSGARAPSTGSRPPAGARAPSTGSRPPAGAGTRESRTASAPTPATAPERDEQRAHREELAAEAADAVAARDDARAEMERAEAAVRDSRETVERLTQQVDQAATDLREAERSLRNARTATDRAERIARRAEERLAEATEAGSRRRR